MLDILQEICKVILSCSHESSKRRFANYTESNVLNLFLRKRGNVEHSLEHLFIAQAVFISSIKPISTVSL